MPKQIKIGFDKTTGRDIPSLEPLLDYGTSLPLKNETGQPLYTDVPGTVDGFYSSKKALSVNINNEKTFVKIEEQFKETTQVSSSLLGIPRAEEQLGLFSDVSVYGFNSDIWEFYTTGGADYQPLQWVRRKNKLYGNRYTIKVSEVPEEQAISINAFPVSWTFPFDINFSKLNLYNNLLYPKYKNFFELGRLLYDSYTNDFEDEIYEEFAKEHFLPPWVGTIENVSGVDGDTPVTVPTVVYNPDVPADDVFSEIEKWTMAWIKMRDGLLFLPNGIRADFPKDERGEYIYSPDNTLPGYSSELDYFGRIESRKAFRYQPGRISGFTFGLRASPDQGSLNNFIEWGAANSTDQYMFQIKGPNFSIVRRSTVPLPDQNILDMGIDPSKQIAKPSRPTFDPDTGVEIPGPPLYELVIQRDFFNKDRLDGSGPSGYSLEIDKVTMYKIEFSWYGAIGAKFYAYVPSGNGDARWVLMHTLVIENKIGQPCLNDPYFKFRYTMNILSTENLVSPQFVYKYGASYYIDGGDEGATTSYSITSDEIDISNINTRSMLGLFPRNTIKNKDGVPIKNKKDVIPSSISVSTDKPIRLDIFECEGCPGFGHHYAPSLVKNESVVSNLFSFSTNGKYISYVNPDFSFTENDINKKLVGDGLYATYIASISDDGSRAFIKRKPGSTSLENPFVMDNEGISVAGTSYTYEYTKKVQLANGQLADVRANTFNIRLVGYNAVAAANIPLTKSNIDINFLNSTPKDNRYRSFNNFYVGVTSSNFAPSIVSNELLFGNAPYDANNTLFGEWSESRVFVDYKGVETTESEFRYGTVFEVDPEIPPVPSQGGYCSRLSVKITEFTVDCQYQNNNGNGIDGNYLRFTDSIFGSLTGLLNGEIGVINPISGVSEASSTTFIEDKATLRTIEGLGQRYYIEVSNSNLSSVTKIVFRVVRIYGRYVNKAKVFGEFNIFPLYVVIGMADNSRVENITIEEYDDTGKFSYSPTWLYSASSGISVSNLGNPTDQLLNNGYFVSGGSSAQGIPGTNFIEIDRLSSISADKQLQQPLRRGEIRSTIFIGENETKEIDLKYLFGQDRYVLTPGLYNTKATFFTAKSLTEPAKTQITVNVKEQ